MSFFSGKTMLLFTGFCRKTTGDCLFFTGRSRRIVRCFFLGTLLAFQLVVFHAIWVSGDLEYSGMVDQAVKNGCCHGAILMISATGNYQQWHRNYHRMTDKLPEGTLLCFPSESAEDYRENYRTLLIIFHNFSGSTYWQGNYQRLKERLPHFDTIVTM